MGPTEGVPSSGGPDEMEEEDLPLREITERYKDKWVGMVVTARDRNLQPTRGKVVAAESDRHILRTKLHKYREICILYGGEPIYPLLQ